MTQYKKSSAALALLALACAPAARTAVESAAPVQTERAAITADELRKDLFVFAADSFGGRETGTPYADKAAHWLVARLTQLGLEPGGDSGFYHRVPMRRTAVTPGEIVVGTQASPRRLAMGRDIAFVSALGPGAPLPKNSVDADLVFAKYGLVDTTLKRDDYAGVAATGKVIVILGEVPADASPEQRKAMENPQMLFNRIGAAIGRQPAGVLLLLPDSVYRLAAAQFTGMQIELGDAEAPKPAQQRILPFIAVAPASQAAFLPPGWPNDTDARFASGYKLKASYQESTNSFNGYNVVGIVRGTDPALRNTFVAYGAHYDHVGIVAPVDGDSISNGADDDGSGSVTLLAVARAWKESPAKRSALFVWHIGEEKGLFGSQAFTDAPTVPLDSIVGQINADMIGRNAPDSLYIVGPGAAPNGQSSVMGAIVDSVNSSLAEPFVFNREWDTTTHPERIYYRSDHYNYARKGIPIVFLTTGLHPEYHQVSDEADLINYEKMARVGDLMLRTGMAIGNRATRPKPTAVQ